MTPDLKKIREKALHAIHYGETLRPARDWFILLIVSIILVLVSCVWNAWVFFEVSNGEGGGNQVLDTGMQGESAVKSSEALFKARAEEVERYRSEYQFVDPS